MNGSFYCKEITESLISKALEDGWSVDEARTGYGIFGSDDVLLGALHVEKIDCMNVFESDLDAGKQAIVDGMKMLESIPDIKSDQNLAYYFIDTEENRWLVYNYLKARYGINWNGCNRKKYSISFQWNGEGSVYCTNIVIASDTETIKKHYARHKIVTLDECNELIVRMAMRKGMPVVEL